MFFNHDNMRYNSTLCPASAHKMYNKTNKFLITIRIPIHVFGTATHVIKINKVSLNKQIKKSIIFQSFQFFNGGLMTRNLKMDTNFINYCKHFTHYNICKMLKCKIRVYCQDHNVKKDVSSQFSQNQHYFLKYMLNSSIDFDLVYGVVRHRICKVQGLDIINIIKVLQDLPLLITTFVRNSRILHDKCNPRAV